MENRFRRHLIAWVIVTCLLLTTVPASALTLGNLQKLVDKHAISMQPTEEMLSKTTTRLSPPKKITLKVGQIKRVNLKLKYKVQPDLITFALDRQDRVQTIINNNNLFVIGRDTGDVLMFMQSGVKTATSRISVSPLPVTGIWLTGDLLQVNQFAVGNLSNVVNPAIASGTVKWTSDRPKVVKVTKKGEITCKKPGNAVITCRTKKGNKLVGNILVIVS